MVLPSPHIAEFATVGSVQGSGEHENVGGVSTAAVQDSPVPAEIVYPAAHIGAHDAPDATLPPAPHIAEFATVGNERWWLRMADMMDAVCDVEGRPLVKLHGLRMLNPEVFSRFPFASADSTNIARNIGIDQTWRGNYMPPTKEMRAQVMRSRIESQNAPPRWSFNVPDTLIEQGSLL